MKDTITPLNYTKEAIKDLSVMEKGLRLRIPLYSITDWHRSPISDSHPFDQPGT